MATNNLLNSVQKHDTIALGEVRAELERIERQLIPLLITIQRMLGKEPSITTREQRRQAAN
jgi:hypothetical protein